MKCPKCDMPRPDDPESSLHLEECPDHDEVTCLACQSEDRGGDDELPQVR